VSGAVGAQRADGPAAGGPAASVPPAQEAPVRRLTGIGIGAGAVVGPVALMAEPEPPPPAGLVPAGDPAHEAARAEAALAEVAADLRRRAESADGESADVLEAQAMMAADPSLADAVRAFTAAGMAAERAVYEAFDGFRTALAGAGEYLAARVADLDDLSARAVAAACGRPMPGVPVRDEPFVLVARDLAPADTAVLDLSLVLALVTEQGGPTSHTAILARARGIPAVVGVDGALGLFDGETLVVDAAAGEVVASPAERIVAATRVRERARREAVAATQAGSVPILGPDGREVRLLANVGGGGEVAAAVAAGAQGVGLFRTELLYLGALRPPTFAEQVEAYRAVLAGFPGRTVVARTLDVGADKQLPFLPLGEEPNPALGVRGLRAFRGPYEHLLDTQLAALAEAAADSPAELWVMAPMITTAEEAAWFAAKARAAGIAQAGVMIEVPAAALTAREVLAEVDFASIGTNDLTQYTMAADRMLGSLGPFQDAGHPAVLRLVALVAEAGAALGRPIGVCGEAAAVPRLAAELVRLGVTSLSMAPAAIPELRAALAKG